MCGSKQCKAITESVMHFMGKEMITISNVEKQELFSMVKELGTRFEEPSRKYFSIYTGDIWHKLPQLKWHTCVEKQKTSMVLNHVCTHV